MPNYPATEFHKLWVIESLRVKDLKTGRRLVDGQLTQAQHAHPHLEVAYNTPAAKQELLNLLHHIRDEARKGIYPMLHFECHGNEDGLGTADGDLIEWDELRKVCIEINHGCRLNLVVVLAACNGIYFMRTAEQLDRAPFWAVIGPETEVNEDDVESDFGAFYTKLFESLDGSAAVLALNRGLSRANRQYHFSSIEAIFLRAYVAYHRDHCTGEGLRKRTEELLRVLMQDPNVRQKGEAWARQHVQGRLSKGDEEEGFNGIKSRYFFLEDFPENADRFPASHNDVIARASATP